MGAWPCGTVTMVGELFSAESKTQVYGSLHTFLQENKDETKTIGKFVTVWYMSGYECVIVTLLV